MNISVQDKTIPIYIILQYGTYFMKFPVNPETLKIETNSASLTENIEGLGPIGIPSTPSLSTLTISSFFWQENNYVPCFTYVDWLKNWQKSKKPAQLIVTRMNYNMQVTCENFSHWINAGEEEDIYFELQLQEYRPYKAKKINLKNEKIALIDALTQDKQKLDEYISHVLIEIPRITRQETRKQEWFNPYITKKSDTILSIAKKVTGDSSKWLELFSENKSTLSDIDENGDLTISEGSKLQLPESWTGGNK